MQRRTSVDEPIGDGFDIAEIARSLAEGDSVLVVGPIGSGKSFVARSVVRALRALDRDPLVIHVPHSRAETLSGALEPRTDPRILRLRDGAADERITVVVDDLQAFDAVSSGIVLQAVYSQRANVLLAIETDDAGTLNGVAESAVDLWLDGLAERIDLPRLSTAEAGRLVDVFADEPFDAVTRDGVIALADGSRMLLREIVAEADAGRRAHRDPLDAVREGARRGRLHDALAAHLRGVPAPQREALATLGRLPGIRDTDAARILPKDDVERLLARGLVHHEGARDRRLVANPLIAGAAEAEIGTTRVEDLLSAIVSRMLHEAPGWWSPAVAAVAAGRWLTARPTDPSWSTAPTGLRARACLDAARLAGRHGDAPRAAALAELGLRAEDDAALRLERAYAEAELAPDRGVPVLTTLVDLDELDDETLLRCVRAVFALWPRISAADVDEVVARADARLGDDGSRSEVDVIRAEAAILDMDWPLAHRRATAAFHRTGATSAVRLMAAGMAGLALTHLGAWAEARRWLLRARHLSDDPLSRDGVTSAHRLAAASLDLVAHGLAGAPATDAAQRVAELRAEAIRHADPSGLASAGIATAIAAAVAADPAAETEIRVAEHRAQLAGATPWIAFARISVARSLALLGDAPAARRIIDRIDPDSVADTRLVDHERWATVAAVLAAEGRHEGAALALSMAAGLAAGSPTLRAADLYQLALVDPGAIETASALAALAAASDLPGTRRIAERAAELRPALPDGDAELLEALRVAARWCDLADPVEREIETFGTTAPSPRRRPPATPREALTRRENEIALLVQEGLSNRDIAGRLFLSVRTVESHIFQARAKVGAASRGELGQIVAARVPLSRPRVADAGRGGR